MAIGDCEGEEDDFLIGVVSCEEANHILAIGAGSLSNDTKG